MPSTGRLFALLRQLYSEPTIQSTGERLGALLDAYRDRLPHPLETSLTERDAIVITYGDQVQAPGQLPLETLSEFCERHLAGVVSGLHLLPFYPWSSDDGFSVKDYRAVDPALGTWPQVERLGARFRLMVDGVINHASAQGEWFQAFQRGDPRYRDYFIVVQDEPNLSAVVRPRTLPLLTTVPTAGGPRRVWTTFSADQVDLNFANPEVLIDILDVLLGYVAHGAQFIRLDAIAYLWKQIGTPCIHLPQTHAMVQLIRAVLDDVAPHVRLITETNVPHADNLSYFGDGHDEAHLVYNFALPPLVLHTLRTGDARALSAWAAALALPSADVSFFNFLASHDGIGLNPARGLLPPADIEALVTQTIAHGGRVSYKSNPDGTHSPYELNINYFDALSDPAGREPLARQVDRFMAAQAILLALAGLPGIYAHSLLGSRGWPAGVELTGHNRAINRQKWQRAELERELADPASLRTQVFERYRRLLLARGSTPAFQPQAHQDIVDLGPALFCLVRHAPETQAPVLALQNITARPQAAPPEWRDVFGMTPQTGWVTDLPTGRRIRLRRTTPLRLRPYESLWLAAGEPQPR